MSTAILRGEQLAIEEILAAARRKGRRTLTEPESKQVLALAGIRIPREKLVKNAAEAVRAAQKLGFPVVLKIVSPDIAHKSDVGGVKLGLHSPETARQAYREMLRTLRSRYPQVHVEGVLVGEMLQGLELILGTATDPQFGPVIMFGLGGIFVECLQDVAFRMIPLDRNDACEMLGEIRGAALLNGFRGSPAVSKDSILEALLRLSDVAHRFRGVIQEIDINPLLATQDGAVAVDALVKLW